MNLADVMEQISDQAATISGLNCFPYPPDSISPPTFEVNLPESIDFDQTYVRGTDAVTLTANVLVGRASHRAAVLNLAPYVAGSGSSSIKAVLEAGTYTAFDTIHVSQVDFAIFPYGAVEYLGAQFTINITGSGS